MRCSRRWGLSKGQALIDGNNLVAGSKVKRDEATVLNLMRKPAEIGDRIQLINCGIQVGAAEPLADRFQLQMT